MARSPVMSGPCQPPRMRRGQGVIELVALQRRLVERVNARRCASSSATKSGQLQECEAIRQPGGDEAATFRRQMTIKALKLAGPRHVAGCSLPPSARTRRSKACAPIGLVLPPVGRSAWLLVVPVPRADRPQRMSGRPSSSNYVTDGPSQRRLPRRESGLEARTEARAGRSEEMERWTSSWTAQPPSTRSRNTSTGISRPGSTRSTSRPRRRQHHGSGSLNRSP